LESSVNKWWQITAWAHKGTIIIQEWKLSFDGMLFYIVIIVHISLLPRKSKNMYELVYCCVPSTFDSFFCLTLAMLDNCYFLIVSSPSFCGLFSLLAILLRWCYLIQILLFLFPFSFRSSSFTTFTCRWIQIHFFIPLGLQQTMDRLVTIRIIDSLDLT